MVRPSVQVCSLDCVFFEWQQTTLLVVCYGGGGGGLWHSAHLFKDFHARKYIYELKYHKIRTDTQVYPKQFRQKQGISFHFTFYTVLFLICPLPFIICNLFSDLDIFSSGPQQKIHLTNSLPSSLHLFLLPSISNASCERKIIKFYSR